MKHSMIRSLFGTLALVTLAASPAMAQIVSDFEAPLYNGSPAGVDATGQDGWALPGGALNQNIYAYPGNALGLVLNPFGSNQFIGGHAGTFGERAQARHSAAFSAGDVWTIAYDLAIGYDGTSSAGTDFHSSFVTPGSANTPAISRSLAQYNLLIDSNNPQLGWNSQFVVRPAPPGGSDTFASAGPAWTNLQLNHWYRQTITIDFSSNTYVELSITDLHTGQLLGVAQPTGWYLGGGAVTALPRPSEFRLSVGDDPGFFAGWDNLSIVPEPTTLVLLGIGFAGLVRGSRRR